MLGSSGRGEQSQCTDNYQRLTGNTCADKREFQISFRGMNRDVLDRIIESGHSSRGKFAGIFLQPIATALYQYSYLLRWKGLPATAQANKHKSALT